MRKTAAFPLLILAIAACGALTSYAQSAGPAAGRYLSSADADFVMGTWKSVHIYGFSTVDGALKNSFYAPYLQGSTYVFQGGNIVRVFPADAAPGGLGMAAVWSWDGWDLKLTFRSGNVEHWRLFLDNAGRLIVAIGAQADPQDPTTKVVGLDEFYR